MRFFLFFLFVPFVSAAYSEILHDDWHYANESFSAGSLDIALSTNSLQDGVAFRYANSSILVKNSTCDETAQYVFCVDNTRQASFDYYRRFYHLQFKLRILAKLAKLELSRTFSDKELFLGESSVVRTRVGNTGSFRASGVVFMDSFPGFFISDSGCAVESSAVTWLGALSPGQSFECSYSISADSNFSFDSVATVNFNDGSKIVAVNSESVRVRSFGPELQFNFNKSSFQGLGESREYNITVRNSAPEEIMLRSFSLTVPYGLVLSKPKLLRKVSEYRYEFSGALAPGVTVLSFNATPQRVRDFVLSVHAQYDASGKKRVFSSNFSVAVLWKNLTLKVASESGNLIASLANPGQSLDNVGVLIDSPCFQKPVERTYLKFLPEQLVDISLPVNSSFCEVAVSVTYDTLYGESFGIKRSFNVSVAKRPVHESEAVDSQREAIPESPAAEISVSDFSMRFVVVAALALILVGVWFVAKKVMSKNGAKGALDDFKSAAPAEAVPGRKSVARTASQEDTAVKLTKPVKTGKNNSAIVHQAETQIEKPAQSPKKGDALHAREKKEPKGSVFRF